MIKISHIEHSYLGVSSVYTTPNIMDPIFTKAFVSESWTPSTLIHTAIAGLLLREIWGLALCWSLVLEFLFLDSWSYTFTYWIQL